MSLKNEKINFIKQFAFEQFQKYGFSRVTMDEIAKKTNTGKGTLYRYFPSKEDLLIAAIEKNITEIEMKLERELNDDIDAMQKINNYITLLSHSMKYLQTSQLSEIERSVPQAYQIICEARERIIFKTLASILEEGKDSSAFRNDLNVDFAVKILVGAAEYMTSPKVLDSLEYMSFAEVIKEIFNTFLQGCYSDESREKSKKF